MDSTASALPESLAKGNLRVVLCCDLDYFYAQCEERLDPSLKGKPLVVCVYSGRSGDSGVVSTANYVARKLGVRSGMPIAHAKRMLKDVDSAFLPVNDTLYEEISERVMKILKGFAERFEQDSIDEAYLDVTQQVASDFDQARSPALEIKRKIWEKEGLTCSIGVGPNKVVAKVASDHQKPDGLTVVKPEEVRAFLSPLPVSRIPGVGRKTEEALKQRGVSVIGELAEYGVERLVSLFGRKLASYIHNAANGIDEEPVRPRAGQEQLSHIVTLKRDSHTFDEILPQAETALKELYARIQEERVSFRVVSAIAVLEDLSMHTRSRSLDHPTDGFKALQATAKELLEAFMWEGRTLGVRRIGVRVSGLTQQAGQKSLAEFVDASS